MNFVTNKKIRNIYSELLLGTTSGFGKRLERAGAPGICFVSRQHLPTIEIEVEFDMKIESSQSKSKLKLNFENNEFNSKLKLKSNQTKIENDIGTNLKSKFKMM